MPHLAPSLKWPFISPPCCKVNESGASVMEKLLKLLLLGPYLAASSSFRWLVYTRSSDCTILISRITKFKCLINCIYRVSVWLLEAASTVSKDSTVDLPESVLHCSLFQLVVSRSERLSKLMKKYFNYKAIVF